ncbi:metal-dependent phosphohydrolase, partial [Candidatus Saccharibacteria bacterium]
MNKDKLIERAQPHYPDVQVYELAYAIDFASIAHKGQKRRSGEDYIVHPLAVAGFLIDWEMDMDTVIAGVLHDTVEDTPVTLSQIESF